MRAAARVAIESRATIVTWAMGLTQHVNAVDNVQTIVDFLLLRGMIGKPGAGACPVRGHSNVQGDRTMGIWEKMPDEWLARLGRELAFDPPRAHGLDTVGSIRAMLDGRAKIFFAMGGNFLSAAPDTERTADALRRCRLTAHVSTKLHRGHLVTGETALILPCLGRTEVDVQAGARPVRHGRGLDGHRARVARLAAPRRRAAPQRDADRGTPGPRDPRRPPAAHRLGVPRGRLRPHPRAHRARRARLRRLRRARCASQPAFACTTAARERVWDTSTGKARFLAHDLPDHRLASRAASHDDDPQPRSVQHDRLRPRRPVPRRAGRAAGGPHERGRRQRARPSRGRRGGHHEPLRGRRADRATLRRSCRTPSRAGAARRTSPRRTCSWPSARSHGGATLPRASRSS